MRGVRSVVITTCFALLVTACAQVRLDGASASGAAGRFTEEDAAAVVAAAPGNLDVKPGETAVVVSAMPVDHGLILLEVCPADARTGEPRHAGKTLALLNHTHGMRSVAYRGTDLYRLWMDLLRSPAERR